MTRIAFTLAAAPAIFFASFALQAAEPAPPAGFTTLFNGKNLAGWYGLNPHSVAKLQGEKREASLKAMRDDFANHWRVENGELVNKGTGPYATTEQEFNDYELMIEYKTVAGADSGIYLRGLPQVQIWDINQKSDPKRPDRNPNKGSGGLFNNTPKTPGRDPLVVADKPFGEWNSFVIRQVGDRTWVTLNGKLVVDGAVMENYNDRTKPFPARGPIMLQTHGGEIRWRNIFVREIPSANVEKATATETLTAAQSDLGAALAFHASFDKGLDADHSTGDRKCYVKKGKDLVAGAFNDELRLDSTGGRFGGALHFTKKGTTQPRFSGPNMLGYNAKNWNTTVSVWLKLTPDKDLEPGYCDPIQIVGDDSKKGFIFLEWSKDETPRFFRYAIRPLFHIWNPTNVQWADIPFEKRPMVQVADAPFSRDRWTHVVFTVENLNDKSKKQSGKLYIDGKLQGSIDGWDLSFNWDPKQVALVLGASYVGRLDDLAVFNRALTEAEVKELHALPNGVKDLR
jgi:hypothetical protein